MACEQTVRRKDRPLIEKTGRWSKNSSIILIQTENVEHMMVFEKAFDTCQIASGTWTNVEDGPTFQTRFGNFLFTRNFFLPGPFLL